MKDFVLMRAGTCIRDFRQGDIAGSICLHGVTWSEGASYEGPGPPCQTCVEGTCEHDRNPGVIHPRCPVGAPHLAGLGTDHPGEGLCMYHSGNTNLRKRERMNTEQREKLESHFWSDYSRAVWSYDPLGPELLATAIEAEPQRLIDALVAAGVLMVRHMGDGVKWYSVVTPDVVQAKYIKADFGWIIGITETTVRDYVKVECSCGAMVHIPSQGSTEWAQRHIDDAHPTSEAIYETIPAPTHEHRWMVTQVNSSRKDPGPVLTVSCVAESCVEYFTTDIRSLLGCAPYTGPVPEHLQPKETTNAR